MRLLEVEGAAHRPACPAVVCLTHRVPYPPDKGDRIRTYHLLKWLGRRYAVHLACLADEPLGPGTVEELGRHCVRLAVAEVSGWSRGLRALGSLARGRTATEGAFWSPALAALLQRWAARTPFAAALASSSALAPYLRLGDLRTVPAVVDLMDVDSQKWLDYAAAGRGPHAWLHALEGHRLRRLERELATWARALLLVSEAEVALYLRAIGAGPVLAVTNGVDLDYFRPDDRESGVGSQESVTGDREYAPRIGTGGPGYARRIPPTPDSRLPTPDSLPELCLFVGVLDYRPNIDGVVWFCREVWPEVLRRRPRARFALVGRRPAPAVRRLAAQPGVDVVGGVPDVRPHLARAAVVVAPLRIARGVQNKVLEALAMARPAVVSPPVLAGLGTGPGGPVLAAATPAEWVEAIVSLLDDPDARRRLGAAGRRHVEECRRWDHCLEPLEALLAPAEAAATSRS